MDDLLLKFSFRFFGLCDVKNNSAKQEASKSIIRQRRNLTNTENRNVTVSYYNLHIELEAATEIPVYEGFSLELDQSYHV